MSVRAILALSRPLLLGFDVDGTLAPIVTTPSRARVPASVVRDLALLADVRGVKLAFITGRDASSLARMLPLPNAYRATLHGKQLSLPGAPPAVLRLGARERLLLSRFEQFFQAELGDTGALLEHKPGALGVHVRRLEARDPATARRVLRAASIEAKRLGLLTRAGRAVVEVEATAGDKGQALARIHRRSRARSVVFLGDDRTDVPALRYASEHGLGLFVRSPERRRSPAGLSGSLPDVHAVHALVSQLRETWASP